jgi:hypothetical protein
MTIDLIGYELRKLFSIDGQRATSGDFRLVGAGHDQRVEAAEFGFQHPAGTIREIGAEGIAAYQFGEVGGLMGGGRFLRAHFPQNDVDAAFGSLPGSFRTGQSAADYLKCPPTLQMVSPATSISGRRSTPSGSCGAISPKGAIRVGAARCHASIPDAEGLLQTTEEN